MKTTKQKKGKTVEVPKKHSAIVGCTGVKKCTYRTGGSHKGTAGGYKDILTEEDPSVLPSSAPQVVEQQLSSREALSRETTEVPKLGPKTGLQPSEKINLQLFPIDEHTRVGLEKSLISYKSSNMSRVQAQASLFLFKSSSNELKFASDGHNPFLELTLRARKKISSVVKHLNRKWGSSTVALGEPMLFPYNIRLGKLMTYKRWTLNDCGTSAGDVYAAIESPAIFRLRYGWFSNHEPKTVSVPSRSALLGACFESDGLQKGCNMISELMDERKERLEVTSQDFRPTNKRKAADELPTKNMPVGIAVDCVDDEVKSGNGLAQSSVQWNDGLTNLSIGGLLSEASLQGKISNLNPRSNESKLDLQPVQLFSSDVSIGGLLFEASLQRKINNYEPKSNGSKLSFLDNGLSQSFVPWDHGLTTLSIGGLLSEASFQGKINNSDLKSNESKLGLQPTPLVTDSLDAFIARQLRSHPQESGPSSNVSHSSIFDAEETCHGFPFRKFSPLANDASPLNGSATPMEHNHDGGLMSFKFSNFGEVNGNGELVQDPPCQEAMTGRSSHLGVNINESSLGLAGIKWTESLGPFDVGLSTSQQITSSDTVGISEFVR